MASTKKLLVSAPTTAGNVSYESHGTLKEPASATTNGAAGKSMTQSLKTLDLEMHGDETIVLFQNTDSNWSRCFDISRMIFSSLLLMLSIFAIVYAITEGGTLWPENVPEFTIYIVLVVSLFCLGTLEGLQIAVVELAHENPGEFGEHYPRAAKLLGFENKGRNVERFLIGRQVLVVGLVFVCARITTFDVFIVDIPEIIISAFFFTGFLGVVLVVIVAQLTPQVLAAAYPVEFMNLPGMSIAFKICLFVETTGIAHAVWLLCYAVKESVYSCVCKHHQKRTKGGVKKTASKEGKERYRNMSDIASTIEMREDGISKAARKRSADRKFTMNNSKLCFEIQGMMQQIESRPDLFYLYGDDKYPGPSYYSEKFKESGVKTPCFLLPPSDENHIPPHIVAMALLRQQSIANDFV